MKKQIITTLLLIGAMGVSAQTRRLPAKISIELSDKEYIDFARKVDSLIMLTANTSNAPSAFVHPFLQRFNDTWSAIDHKVALQMVIDTVNKKKGGKS